jgi:hypothetical protein
MYITSTEYVKFDAAFFAGRRRRLAKESCLD